MHGLDRAIPRLISISIMAGETKKWAGHAERPGGSREKNPKQAGSLHARDTKLFAMQVVQS